MNLRIGQLKNPFIFQSSSSLVIGQWPSVISDLKKRSPLLMRIRYFVILAAAAMLLPILYGQTNKSTKSNPDADWPMYNHDLAGTRYSPLTQINAKNVTNLTQAWSFRLGPAGPNGSLNTSPAQEGDVAGVAPAAGARGGRGGATGGPTSN